MSAFLAEKPANTFSIFFPGLEADEVYDEYINGPGNEGNSGNISSIIGLFEQAENNYVIREHVKSAALDIIKKQKALAEDFSFKNQMLQVVHFCIYFGLLNSFYCNN